MNRLGVQHFVTFDLGGYDLKTDRYAVTCPACHTRQWFAIRGGNWPRRCRVVGCCAHWYWNLGAKVAKCENVGPFRRMKRAS